MPRRLVARATGSYRACRWILVKGSSISSSRSRNASRLRCRRAPRFSQFRRRSAMKSSPCTLAVIAAATFTLFGVHSSSLLLPAAESANSVEDEASRNKGMAHLICLKTHLFPLPQISCSACGEFVISDTISDLFAYFTYLHVARVGNETSSAITIILQPSYSYCTQLKTLSKTVRTQ